jgi:hypothetical protein
MLQTVWDSIQAFLGYERAIEDVNAIQMALRTIVIYAATLVLIRIGSKRFLGQATAFDVIIGIMLGSVMSRAINGSAPLFPTLLTGAVFVGLHRLLNVLAFRTGWFGSIIKGSPVLLIKDGKIQRQGVRKQELARTTSSRRCGNGAKKRTPPRSSSPIWSGTAASALFPTHPIHTSSMCPSKTACRPCA